MNESPTLIDQLYFRAYEINSRYRKRNINENLRSDTVNLLKDFYQYLLLRDDGQQESTPVRSVSDFKLSELRLLTMSAEILDVYSAFGKNLGDVFSWIKDESRTLYSKIIETNTKPDYKYYKLEPRLQLEQIRFAALHLIEKYRGNKGDSSKYGDDFQKLINIVVINSFDDNSLINHKHNILSYLYFWLGKCHRSVDFIAAKHCYENSESHLLHIAANVSIKSEIEKNEKSEETRSKSLANQWHSDIKFDVLEILRRISLVTLAQAQLALMMGRAKDASMLVEKAESTCAESDLLAKGYANFISGTCLRYLNGRKNSEETIKRLQSAYDVFISSSEKGVPQPRHVIRTMRELVLTSILRGELKDAEKVLNEVQDKAFSEHPLFKKIRNNYLWRFYNLSLRSRIARKKGVRHQCPESINEAIEYAKKSLEEVNHLTVAETIDGKFALGEAYFAAQQYQLAINEFDELIKINSAEATEQKQKQKHRKNKTAEGIRRNYEHPEVFAICYLYLSWISKRLREEDDDQKYSVLFRQIEKRGQIENSWISDLKEQIKNDEKSIEVKISKADINRLQSGEKLHSIYKNDFIREMISAALALHENNATETAKFLGYERTGFSHLIKELLPHLIKTRERKSK